MSQESLTPKTCLTAQRLPENGYTDFESTTDPFYVNAFGNTCSGFGTVGHDLHRIRRAAINPFFSKQKVAALQPVIQQLVDKLCNKFEKCKGTGEVIPMECAFDAFTMDVITEYALDTSFVCIFGALITPFVLLLELEDTS